MKALTLTQPWATLVAIRAKQIETRGWNTAYRGPIAIHAAKGLPAAARALATEAIPFYTTLSQAVLPDGWDDILPLGAVLATAHLDGVVRFKPGVAALEEVIHAHSSAPNEVSFGDFTAGRYGFVLSDVRILPVPIPAKGSLGLWEWSDPAHLVAATRPPVLGPRDEPGESA